MTDDLKKLEEDIRKMAWPGSCYLAIADRLKAIREQPDDLEEILTEIIKTIDVMSGASRTASNAATKRIEALEAVQKQLLHRAAPENLEKRLEFDPKAICQQIDAGTNIEVDLLIGVAQIRTNGQEYYFSGKDFEDLAYASPPKLMEKAKELVIGEEKRRAIAQMDKMIAEALK